LKSEENEKFYPSKVKEIAHQVLRQEVDDSLNEKNIEEWTEYGDDFETLSKHIADEIKNRCLKELNLPRYKLVVQVTIGQMKDQGVLITSRCMWDTVNDNYASVHIKNQHIWASVLVFGLYAE